MLKFTTYQVTFREIPDEITLCLNIANCPIHCPECHSKELWSDVGTELTTTVIDNLIKNNQGISCIVFMGGDGNYADLENLINYIKEKFPIKIGFYSGRETIKDIINLSQKFEWIQQLAYIKVGPYKSECGPINSPTTNQRMFELDLSGALLTDDVTPIYGIDITNKFLKSIYDFSSNQ